MPTETASLTQPDPQTLQLSGAWTALGVAAVAKRLDTLSLAGVGPRRLDASAIQGLDSAGAWLLHGLLVRLRAAGPVELVGLRSEWQARLDLAAARWTALQTQPAPLLVRPPSALAALGGGSLNTLQETIDLLDFIGDCALAAARSVVHPTRIRWRTIAFNLRTAGVDAMPIVGLLAVLLGIVVAYQGAAQLQQFGANIFIVDLVGVSMLREFAPLITAIIVAGRSGSAYAAQIGTMAVTEEIDALRTLGIAPIELLVLPKVVALMIALPLLTVLADGLGVMGGMLMAQAQLGVGFGDFLDRFATAVDVTTLLTGLGKAPVFAAVIAVIGCFQGFRTQGGADSVGRQTTRSVVQSIFAVIVVDALFSVVFSALDL